MQKSVLFRWFGLGVCPEEAREALAGEGPVFLDEGISGRMVSRGVSGPGRRCRYRSEWFLGTLAVSGRRLMLYSFARRQINIALDDERLALLEFRRPGPGMLCIAFEAGAFRDGWTGRLEYRLKTAGADGFQAAPPAARAAARS